VTAIADRIRVWEDPAADEVGSSVEEFLQRLEGPTWLQTPGRDRSRSRAFVTLLHGNEPSGTRALHAWLRSGARPAVDLVAFVGTVQTALTLPHFSHRTLPARRDLNRCFQPPFLGLEGQLASELLQRLRELQPEALIDLHNTSGAGPAYGVTTRLDAKHEALTAFFARRLIHTRLRLGALVEATEEDCPTVTIECGGVGETRSDEIALEGLTRYAAADPLFEEDARPLMSVLRDPIRVELRKGARIAYGPEPVADVDLTLCADLERHNFGILNTGELLGWLGPAGVDALVARDADGRERTSELFEAHEGCLRVARPLEPLMVTTDLRVAMSDCLFYVVFPEAGVSATDSEPVLSDIEDRSDMEGAA